MKASRMQIMLCRAAALGYFFFLASLVRAEPPVMRAHFIDVGQANATLLEFPCGVALIDAGAQDDARIAALITYIEEVFRRRRDLNRTIDEIFITHNHADHTRALRELIEHFSVRTVIENGQRGGFPGDRDLDWAWEEGRKGRSLKVIDVDDDSVDPNRGLTNPDIDPFVCADVNPEIGILGADLDVDPGWGDDDFRNKNNHSIVVRVDFGDSSFLFPGDLEVPALERLRVRLKPGLLNVDVLEVSHHGSSRGTTERFLDAVSPRIAVISAGHWDNDVAWSARRFGHPRRSTIEQLLGAVSDFRTSPSNVMVASGPRAFEQFTVTNAIYSTGWDGNVVVSATPAGELSVRASRQDLIHESIFTSIAPPSANVNIADLVIAAVWRKKVVEGQDFRVQIAIGTKREITAWKRELPAKQLADIEECLREDFNGVCLREGNPQVTGESRFQIAVSAVGLKFNRDHPLSDVEVGKFAERLLYAMPMPSGARNPETGIDLRLLPQDQSNPVYKAFLPVQVSQSERKEQSEPGFFSAIASFLQENYKWVLAILGPFAGWLVAEWRQRAKAREPEKPTKGASS